eukprot:UN23985
MDVIIEAAVKQSMNYTIGETVLLKEYCENKLDFSTAEMWAVYNKDDLFGCVLFRSHVDPLYQKKKIHLRGNAWPTVDETGISKNKLERKKFSKYYQLEITISGNIRDTPVKWE